MIKRLSSLAMFHPKIGWIHHGLRTSIAKCCNNYWLRRNDVYQHLIVHGFVKGYRKWINHGEPIISMNVDSGMNQGGNYDDIAGLLRDAFRDMPQVEEGNKGPNEEAKRFYKLVDEASQELYPSCTNGFSRLSFTIRLYFLKCLHGWSNASFTPLLELLKEVMPDLNIPTSFHKTKNMVKDLGLDYEKIDACSNDCMLYRNEYKNYSSCYVCGVSRYINPVMDNDEVEPLENSRNIAAKTLRYFPLIPRLKRLFMCPATAEALRWHDEQRLKDGKLRHPADGQSWKDFDNRHSFFAKDLRNIRLGLASDGFNPFRNMNVSHSTCENNEDPSQCEMFIATWKDKKGETKDPRTQEMIDHLQNLKESGHSDDEAFQSLFGKERPGRVCCYGRTVTKSSLKKEKEIKQIKQEHKREVAQLQDEVHHVNHKMDGLTNLVKVLLQQVNPGLSTEQVQAMIEVAQQSPPDASSAPNQARRNIPPSSGSSHVPTNMEEDI